MTTSELLNRLVEGDESAFGQLFANLYPEFMQIAKNHVSRNILQTDLTPTEIVHEVYLRLINSENRNPKSRSHFLALSSKIMRQVILDRARRNLAQRRGGGQQPIQFEDEQLSIDDAQHVVAVHDALEKLGQIDPFQASIVEMRFFGGLSVLEVAEVLDKSKRSIESEWTMIRAWLRHELSEGQDAGS